MHCEKTRILIQGLRLECCVGVSRGERETRQSVEVDVQSELTQPRIAKDDISCTVSYSDLVKDIRVLVGERSFILLETMAEEIAKTCFQDPRIERLTITLRKPKKLPACEAVGVERTFVRE